MSRGPYFGIIQKIGLSEQLKYLKNLITLKDMVEKETVIPGKVTSGQKLHLPNEVCEHLQLKGGDRVLFTLRSDKKGRHFAILRKMSSAVKPIEMSEADNDIPSEETAIAMDDIKHGNVVVVKSLGEMDKLVENTREGERRLANPQRKPSVASKPTVQTE